MNTLTVTSTERVEQWPPLAQARGTLRAHEEKDVSVQLHVMVDHAAFDGDHLIIIPIEAIADRMLFYGLDTQEAAIDAILREHVVRLGDLEPHDTETRQGTAGGLHPEVELSDTSKHVTVVLPEIAQAVDEHLVVLQQLSVVPVEEDRVEVTLGPVPVDASVELPVPPA